MATRVSPQADFARRCDDLPVGEREAAQAVKFIITLREHVNEMTAQLARLEDKSARATGASMVAATRVEAAALRRDISEAQLLIERLRTRYLKADQRTQRR